MKSHWKKLFPLMLWGIGTPLGASPAEEQELTETIMAQLVEFSQIAMEEADSDNPGIMYAKMPDEHNQTPCYPLAWLYKNRHPKNPLLGQRRAFDQAVAICDHIAEIRSTLEWPMYNLCQVFSLLETDLSAETRERWRRYAEYYVGTRGIKPFFYTSFNHEAWNALAVFRAGQVFNEPAWEEQGRRLMRQLLKLQTRLGYFDEGPHHGPSMKYNHTQLAPMLLFADYARDPEALDASKRLADFMIRYSFPDGSPIGCFDGRQSWSLGYYSLLCYGLDRWPLGKELNRRLYRTRKKWGFLSAHSKHFNLSDWYAYFGFGFLMDEYLSLRPEAPAKPLPQDRNGYLMVEEGPSFGGGVARTHDWMVAISAINSDMPREAGSVYRLERQSRLDVWHDATGLIIGGGHNKREADLPLANFQVLTGYDGVDSSFGRLSGGDWHDRRAVYIPRKVTSDITLGRQVLTETFGQGDVSLTAVPLDRRRLRIQYRHDLFTVKKFLVQLPVIVYYNSSLEIDGQRVEDAAPRKVSRDILLTNPTMNSKIRITVPEGAEAVLQPGVFPLRWYIGEHPPGRYEPFYAIRLLSVQIGNPPSLGSGEFLVEIL